MALWEERIRRVVTKPEASTQYESTWLVYAKNGQTVAYVIGEVWEEGAAYRNPGRESGDNASGRGQCLDNYEISYAREFRYDSGRARYLNRRLDPDPLMEDPPVFMVLSETWTDYDGDESYGDFTVSGGTASDARSFELGVATVDPWLSMGGTNTKYYHPDLIGTTRSMSTAAGSPTQAAVYTAFGERISGANHRYGYAGEWGYQAHSDVPFLHVGARYYDPSTGRFLQRDPMGPSGGANVYAYANSRPTLTLDPQGLDAVVDPHYWGHRGRPTAPAPFVGPPAPPAPDRPEPATTPHGPQGILVRQRYEVLRGKLAFLRRLA
jgi:RHS repeat-associated protein